MIITNNHSIVACLPPREHTPYIAIMALFKFSRQYILKSARNLE